MGILPILVNILFITLLIIHCSFSYIPEPRSDESNKGTEPSLKNSTKHAMYQPALLDSITHCTRCSGSRNNNYCNACPRSSCLNHQAVYYGYCCGCALNYDYFHIHCPMYPRCPYNMSRVCRDYDYMKRCCCPGYYSSTFNYDYSDPFYGNGQYY